MRNNNQSENLIWIDLEMSGLDPQTDLILEIASIVTDSSLNVIAEGPNLVINQDKELFSRMDDWNQSHHTTSGLWDQVLQSSISTMQAQSQTLDFLKEHCEAKVSPLCGNSIAQDKMFLLKHMPELADFMHYRLIDVSTIKELTKRWYKNGPRPAAKKGMHRALDDIKESIEELRFYREKFFLAGDKID